MYPDVSLIPDKTANSIITYTKNTYVPDMGSLKKSSVIKCPSVIVNSRTLLPMNRA